MMAEEKTEPKRDKVADWRYTECLRLVGHEHAQAFADSGIDLHRLERLVRSGATSEQLKEWMIGD